MQEMINRQSALSVCKEYGWIDDEVFIEGYNTAIKDMREAIKKLPTVEAEPVRHGRWIMLEPYGVLHTHCRKCSECGEIKAQELTNFCPNCGARNERIINNAGSKTD